MKVVLDTMLWVSYCTRRDGPRQRLIDEALKARVRTEKMSGTFLEKVPDIFSARLFTWTRRDQRKKMDVTNAINLSRNLFAKQAFT
jgi:hypothetical protein